MSEEDDVHIKGGLYCTHMHISCLLCYLRTSLSMYVSKVEEYGDGN